MLRLNGATITRIEEALAKMNARSATYVVAEDGLASIRNKAHRLPRHLAIEEFVEELQRILPERRVHPMASPVVSDYNI